MINKNEMLASRCSAGINFIIGAFFIWLSIFFLVKFKTNVEFISSIVCLLVGFSTLQLSKIEFRQAALLERTIKIEEVSSNEYKAASYFGKKEE